MPNLRWAMDAENSKGAAAGRGTSTAFRPSSNGGVEARMRKTGGGNKATSTTVPGAPGGGVGLLPGVGVEDSSAAEAGATSASLCAGCGLPIVDRYILRVMEHSWHESCLQCSVCHAPLEQSCYSRDKKLFCKADYDK
ncbi:LIM homeobox transcription factor 1-beta isoform X2 [Ixodes scapularis]